MKKQSFFAGTLILMTANALSKILGAIFKIPLTYILREEGMAIYNTAFSVYIMFLSFVTSGIPTAVSKGTAQSEERGAYVLTGTAAAVLSVLGVIGSAAIYFGADFFALAMKEPAAGAAIRLISPSVFFVALGAAYKSFFHGASDMIPPAVSQIIEAFVKLGAGYFLALSLSRVSGAAGAAGAVCGVTAGEIIATAILIIGYYFEKRRVKIRAPLRERAEAAGEIFSVAAPLMITAVVSNVISVTDTSILRSRLLHAGLSADRARFLYGAYTGYAMTIFNLPTGILATIGVSILSAAASAVASGDMKKAQKPVDSGLELTLFISVPCAAAMWLIPDVLLKLLFKNASSALMLKALAPCVICVSLIQTASAAIQACGKILLQGEIMIAGLLLKLALVWYFAGRPEYNIYGAAISSDIAFFLIMVSELAALKKITGIRLGLAGKLVKPLAASIPMGAAVMYARTLSDGGTISSAAVCLAGGAAYLAAMCAMNLKKIKTSNILNLR